MLDVYAFYVIAAATVLAGLLVFVQKRLIRAVILLAAAFASSALLFFLIGQSLIAILQLIIFVGGFSTYLIVAVATEERNANLIRLPVFLILAVLLFAGMVFALQSLPTQGQNSGSSFLTAASSAFQSSFAIFYIIAALLFAATIGGVMIIKRFTKLLV